MKKFSAMLVILTMAAMVMSFTSGDNDLTGQEIVYIQAGSASCSSPQALQSSPSCSVPQIIQTYSPSCAGGVPGGNGGGQIGFEGYSVPLAYYVPRVVYSQPRAVRYYQPRYVQYAQPRYRARTVRYNQSPRYYNWISIGGLGFGYRSPGYSRSVTYGAPRGY